MPKPLRDTRNRSSRRTAPSKAARAGHGPFEEIVSQRGPDLCTSLERIYQRIFAEPDSLGEFLAKTCVQHVGRLALDYAQIVDHVLHVRQQVKSIEYSVSHAIARGDSIADRHLVELTLYDGRAVTLEVLCVMRLQRGRIAELYESSNVLAGDQALGALATATN